ncbi:helicase SNF2 [Variovorax sp. GT1P44]|uniref:helicase SNF2 n=1 Tax=Variovorax sp. GT1P44 TaxID=3443742 RepID=UPI003F445EBA
MNTASKLLSGFALAIIAAAGVHAETYDGVHAPVSANNRADIKSQAVVAARSENPYAEGASAGVPQVTASVVDRSSVRSQAVVAAHSADPYAEGASATVAPILASTVDRASVRAEARAAARSNELAL